MLNKQELVSDDQLLRWLPTWRCQRAVPHCVSLGGMGSNLDGLLDRVWHELGI